MRGGEGVVRCSVGRVSRVRSVSEEVSEAVAKWVARCLAIAVWAVRRFLEGFGAVDGPGVRLRFLG